MMRRDHRIIVVEPVASVASHISLACAEPAETVESLAALREYVDTDHLQRCCLTIVVGPSVDLERAATLSSDLRRRDPQSGVILVRPRLDTGTLAAALRSGVREVLSDRDLPDLHAAIRRSQSVGAHWAGRDEPVPDRGKVTTVFAAKGGVGKTTVSTCLAVYLARRGERAVLVDLDLAFGDVAVTLNLFPERSFADLCSLDSISAADVESALVTHESGLRILSAPAEPSVAERISTESVSEVLTLLVERFDHVIVDTAPALDERVLAAIDVTDVLVLVATLDVPALKNLRLALDTLDLIGVDRQRQRVVLNRADAEVGVLLSDVPEALERDISATLPSSRDVPASVNSGVPIVSALPHHPVSVAIGQFADATLPGPAVTPSGESASSTSDSVKRSWPRLRRPVAAP